MCVETLGNPRTGLVFLWDDRFGGSHCLGLLYNALFPIYLLGNPINVWWNPQNRACFSDLRDDWSPWNPINVCWRVFLCHRGHMPRFTLKMNVFPSISLERAHFSHKCRFDECFPIYPSEQGLFFFFLRDHMPRFTLKMNPIYLQTP